MKSVSNFDVSESDESLYLVLVLSPATGHAEQRHSRYLNAAQKIIFTFFNVSHSTAADDQEAIDKDVEPMHQALACSSSGTHENKSDFETFNLNHSNADECQPCGSNSQSPTDDRNGEATQSDTETVEESESEVTIEELYVKLRDSHALRDTFDRDVCVQHSSMLPTLTAYQRSAVQWMLHRENGRDHFPSEFIRIMSRWPVEGVDPAVFYYHPRKVEITDEWIPFIDIPTGGILAEEMGLGKTVETLSLVLLNRRSPSQCDSFDSARASDDSDSDDEPLIKKVKRPDLTEAEFKCTCTKFGSHDPKKLIQCIMCHRTQHRRCVLKHVIEPNVKKYICPDCWQYEAPVQSSATFIVSPASIKMQWFVEIEKHIVGSGLKVLIYDGINKTGWISPVELASYDVVLTDYNVMASEIHFTNCNKTDRQMRNPSRFMNLPSPLLMIDWWRVCLDEAQMVETSNNQAARMVKLLPATHRWAVTGTPLEKSIHDLYGLLYFLGCEPFDNHQKWSRIAEQFTNGTN